MKKYIVISILTFVLLNCGGKRVREEIPASVVFCADSAYRYISEQVEFGARIPGSAAHEQCVRYLKDQLQRFGAEVETEQGQMIDYEGKQQQVVNIIGHFGAHDKRRLLLCAHYDSRPWADQEEEYANRMQPVPGANDGASGVGVLLEVARQIGLMQNKGEAVPAVDIVFFDCEDMGTPDFYTGTQRENTWCLGSQLWAKQHDNRQTKQYKYGILLDMVGASDAVFEKEYYSVQYAGNYVEKIWRTAEQLGYGGMFRNEYSYPITDDHYYINTLAGIPCIDIIHYSRHSDTGFAHWWHTVEDDMRHISPATLEAVGKTIIVGIQ